MRRTLAIIACACAGAALAQWKDSLRAGDFVGPGQRLISHSGRFFAVTQSDGDLCVFDKFEAGPVDAAKLWCHGKTGFRAAYFTVQQPDGALCTYEGANPTTGGSERWCSPGGKAPGQYLALMQDDGNLCTYDVADPASRKKVWCSGATRPPRDPPPAPGLPAVACNIPTLRGTVRWFDITKGLGFITPGDGGLEVLFYYSGIVAKNKSLAEGDKVKYGVCIDGKGVPIALSVGPDS